jgi:hypothetical protein
MSMRWFSATSSFSYSVVLRLVTCSLEESSGESTALKSPAIISDLVWKVFWSSAMVFKAS